MSDAIALLAFAVGAGTAGAALLRRARWPARAPRLGVAAWQALSGAVLSALLLAGVSLAVPASVVSSSLADLLHACVMALRARYATPGGAVLASVGAAAALLLAARTGYLVTAGLARARRARAEHLAGLRLAARRDAELDALVVEHEAAAAYCLPGRGATVVLTSAAVQALDDGELAAVLAHERAHLRGRHHLVAAGAQALAGAVPFLPVFGWAREEQARLLEMIADDAAVDGGSRLLVARALLHLAEGSVPAAALGAADLAAVARIQRLLDPIPRLGGGRRLVVSVAIVATALAPLLIAALPALTLAWTTYCPVALPAA